MSVIAVLATLIPVAWAADLTVTPGDDIRALTASLGPGDVVTFAKGTYKIESELYWNFEGSVTQPVTLKADEGAEVLITLIDGADGDYPGQIVTLQDAKYIVIEGLIFQGDGPSDNYAEGDGHNGINLIGTSYVTFRDVEVRNVTWNGFYAVADNDHLTLERVQVHDTENGRAFIAGCYDGSCWLSDSLITNCWFHSLRGEDGGIYLYDGAQGNIIRHTVIHDVDAQGIRIGDTFGGEENTLFGNVIWDVDNQAIETRGPSIIQNNLIFSVDGYGIKTSDQEGVISDVVISFNTILDTTEYAIAIYEWWSQEGMVLANNALCNPTGLGLYYGDHETDTGLETTDNLITNNVVCGYVDATGLPPEAVLLGGGFYDYLNVDSWDFYPVQGSALVDAADPAGETFIPDTDFNGAPRDGDAPDVGAYAWSGDGNPGWQVRESFKELGYEREGQAEQVGGCCNQDGSTGQALLWLPLALVGAGWRRRD